MSWVHDVLTSIGGPLTVAAVLGVWRWSGRVTQSLDRLTNQVNGLGKDVRGMHADQGVMARRIDSAHDAIAQHISRDHRRAS